MLLPSPVQHMPSVNKDDATAGRETLQIKVRFAQETGRDRWAYCGVSWGVCMGLFGGAGGSEGGGGHWLGKTMGGGGGGGDIGLGRQWVEVKD